MTDVSESLSSPITAAADLLVGTAATGGAGTTVGEPGFAEPRMTIEAVGARAADSARRFSLGNRPPLTGIRAIGVTLVLIFHSNFKTLPGSWVALGVFFVLSGFLITAMLSGEHQKTGRISLSKFYWRRATRLLPPLVITVALLGLYAAIVPVANAANRIWGDAAGALFYYSDYRSAFGHEPFLGFMAQCWSLAVEEQFYLVWAVLFVIALRYGNRRVAYALATAGIVISLVNRVLIVLGAAHWNSYVAGRVYYAFDTRADALFLGCLLGLIASDGHLQNWSRSATRVLTGLAVVSTAVMVWIILTVGLASRALPLWWLPISEVACAVIITYFVVRPEGFGSRAVGLPFLVWVGNMSYTIYIIHWPIYVAISPFTVRWSYWTTEGVRLAIIFPLAIASWYLMERPLMRWRRKALNPAGEVGAVPGEVGAVPGPVGAVPGEVVAVPVPPATE